MFKHLSSTPKMRNNKYLSTEVRETLVSSTLKPKDVRKHKTFNIANLCQLTINFVSNAFH